jgi:hypothetical protein
MATWNVRSVLQPGKMQRTANKIQKFQTDTVALHKIRWTRQGTTGTRDYTLTYSGSQKRRQLGTVYMIAKAIRQNVSQT